MGEPTRRGISKAEIEPRVHVGLKNELALIALYLPGVPSSAFTVGRSAGLLNLRANPASGRGGKSRSLWVPEWAAGAYE